MLTPDAAVATCRQLLSMRLAERERLERIRSYWLGEQPLPIAPYGVPEDVRRMARMSRVNLCGLVVNVPAQSMFVVGIRDDNAPPGENDPLWSVWQANRMDARQSAVHRATFAYGTSYEIVLPGAPEPVAKGKTPRQLTVAFGDDPDWPEFALEVLVARDGATYYELYDAKAVYTLREDADAARQANEPYHPVFDAYAEHQATVCPVVCFRNLEDLEHTPHSEIEPIIPLQDQLDFTTFDLLVAQHFGAFRQRYILGWTSDDENEKVKAAASRLWTFDDDSKTIQVGEFAQTDLSGYLDSRKATLEHFGVISQVPPHNLLGQMVNLSAEALVAAEASANRKNADRETTLGESWEQWFWLAGKYRGETLGTGAQVRWRDTEARSLAQTVDALGKMAQMLGVPAEALWARIPGVTQQDVEEWKAMRASDALAGLFSGLDRQMADPTSQDAPQAA
jgi:hypothetical protein